MKCLSRETLQRLIDHDLSPAEQVQAERHLEACSRCTARAESLRSRIAQMQKQILRSTPQAPPLPVFLPPQHGRAGAVTRWLAEAATIPFWLHRYWKPVVPACLVLCLVVAYGLTRHEPKPAWPTPYDDWSTIGSDRNPNERWHERELVVTVDDLRTGTRTQYITSAGNENITSQSHPVPRSTNPGD